MLDPQLICKKPRRLRGKLHDICKNETSLMKEIAKGINMGFRECEYQFKYRRWNCTSVKKSMKKILVRGKDPFCFLILLLQLIFMEMI